MPRGRKKVDVVEEKKLVGKFNNDVLVKEITEVINADKKAFEDALAYFSNFIDTKYENNEYRIVTECGLLVGRIVGEIDVVGLSLGDRSLISRVERILCAERGFKSVFIKINTKNFQKFFCEITIHPVMPPKPLYSKQE
jgi:hypothetical protein